MFGIVLDVPPMMAEEHWRVSVLLDDRASEEQAGKIGQVPGGELGGPLAMLAPVIGEMPGFQQVPITYEDDDRQHRARYGDTIDVEVMDMVNEPARMTNISHLASSTLTVAPRMRSTISAFRIEFHGTDTSGFSGPFNWYGA